MSYLSSYVRINIKTKVGIKSARLAEKEKKKKKDNK